MKNDTDLDTLQHGKSVAMEIRFQTVYAFMVPNYGAHDKLSNKLII